MHSVHVIIIAVSALRSIIRGETSALIVRSQPSRIVFILFPDVLNLPIFGDVPLCDLDLLRTKFANERVFNNFGFVWIFITLAGSCISKKCSIVGVIINGDTMCDTM